MMKRLIFLLLTLLVAGSAMAAQTVQVMTNGTIDIDKLPTLDFSYETDPSNPADGQIWWNETTKQLKVADSAGIYEFNGTLVEWDTTPTAFSFADIENATTDTVYTSAAITVAGINHPAAISVSGDAAAKYSINNATAVSTNGTVEDGDTVQAVVTSSESGGTAVNATVTIGGVSDAYVVTTVDDVVPVTYLLEEDFEGTGTPSGFTASGTPDFDYTSAGLDMVGDEVFEIGASDESICTIPGGAVTDVTIVFKVKASAVPASAASFIGFRDAGGSSRLNVQVASSSGWMSFTDGSTISQVGASVSSATRWVKFRTYVSAGLRYYIASYWNGSSWVDGTLRSTANTNRIKDIRLYNYTSITLYLDEFRITSSDVTGSPE